MTTAPPPRTTRAELEEIHQQELATLELEHQRSIEQLRAVQKMELAAAEAEPATICENCGGVTFRCGLCRRFVCGVIPGGGEDIHCGCHYVHTAGKCFERGQRT